MNSAQKQQLIEAVTALQKADLPPKLKLDALNAILQPPVMPYGHVLRTLMQDKDAETKLDQLTAMSLIMLPLLEEAPPPQTPKLPEDLGRQIETEVRNSLNEKFVRSPAFMLLLAVVAAGVTIFSYGLFTFSSSARRADVVAAEFEKRLDDAAAKILASERDLTTRLNGEIDRISDMQSNSIKALGADLSKRIKEVDGERDAAVNRIKALSDQFQLDKNDAVQSLKDQAAKISPRLDAAANEAVGQIQTTTRKELEEFKKQADRTVAELGQPAIKYVLVNSYRLIVAALILSVIAIVFLGIGLVKRLWAWHTGNPV